MRLISITTIRSRTLDSTGTTEMGLKSSGPVGVFVLATEWISAALHCSGMVDVLSEWLNRLAIHHEQTGARRRRNHAGIRSRRSAVGLRLSRVEKTLAS